jgi:MFS family permease
MHQRLPMLDLALFRNGTVHGANIVAILVTLAMFGIFVFFPIYMQSFLGWSPIQAGAALLPWTILIVIFAPIAGKLSDRVGSRWLIAGGMTNRGTLLPRALDRDCQSPGSGTCSPASSSAASGWRS